MSGAGEYTSIYKQLWSLSLLSESMKIQTRVAKSYLRLLTCEFMLAEKSATIEDPPAKHVICQLRLGNSSLLLSTMIMESASRFNYVFSRSRA